MSSRFELIARKNEVIARINRLQRELSQEQSKGENASSRRISNLQDELDKLQAEEYRLRLAIDRSK